MPGCDIARRKREFGRLTAALKRLRSGRMGGGCALGRTGPARACWWTRPAGEESRPQGDDEARRWSDCTRPGPGNDCRARYGSPPLRTAGSGARRSAAAVTRPASSRMAASQRQAIELRGFAGSWRSLGILEGAARADLAGDVAASNATPHIAFAQERLSLFRIGDAALALDPISGSGIQAALQSAVDATLAIHTLTEDPAAGGMAKRFLERRLERRAARHIAWTAAFYGQAAKVFATPFWTARAGAAPSPELLPRPRRISLSG